MEAPNLLENENIPQKRKFLYCQVAFYTSIFVFIILALVCIVFCLRHHQQAPGSCWAHGSLKVSSTPNFKGLMSWEWNFEHCNGFVQKDSDQYLVIKQSSNYFIYAQVNRKVNMNLSFALALYKEPDVLLNKVVGPSTALISSTKLKLCQYCSREVANMSYEGSSTAFTRLGNQWVLRHRLLQGLDYLLRYLGCALDHLRITGRSQYLSKGKVLLEKQAAVAA